MKKLKVQSFKKNQGFVEISVMIVLALIIGLIAYMMNKAEPMSSAAKEQMYLDSFMTILSGARTAARGNVDGFASLTISGLSNGVYISKSYADGSGTNPDGGDWNLTGSTVNTLIINTTGVGSVLCTRVAEKLNIEFTASCTTGTVKLSAN